MEKIIGVVGGAGPFAGLDLLGKILDQTIAERDQDHLTVINLSQPNQLPDRTRYLLGETAVNPAHAIFNQLQQLERDGAAIAAIPCNTAHAPIIFDCVIEQLRAAGSQLKFLNMIVETVKHIQKQRPEKKRIGILSTTGTYKAGFYPHLLESVGFTAVTPDIHLQTEIIHPAIYDPQYGIKTLGKNANLAREGLLEGINSLQKKGAETIILGCTEIPLAIPEQWIGDLLIIDPTRILARALIREVNPDKLKPSG